MQYNFVFLTSYLNIFEAKYLLRKAIITENDTQTFSGFAGLFGITV